MISNQSFDYYLKHGFIKGLEPGTPMQKLLQLFGEAHWYVKEIENNGLTYGIIKVGITEFHIYNEKLHSYSYRPDIMFDIQEYKGYSQPWIIHYTSLRSVQAQLIKRKIKYKVLTFQGSRKNISFGGSQLYLSEDEEYTFLETQGGVALGFEKGWNEKTLRICRASRYYDFNDPINDFQAHLNAKN